MGVGRILASVCFARLFQWRIRNAKEFARYWIGAELLYRSGLEAYMRRFYGSPPEQIDVVFAQKRMQWISEHATLRSLWQRATRRSQAPCNQQLARPKEGFAHLYSAVKERLEACGVTFCLGSKIQSLSPFAGQFKISLDGQDYTTNRLISTIPVEKSAAIFGIDHEPIEAVTLISLFFSFSGDRGFANSILYNFSHDGDWKRIIVYSDFYGSDGREYFTAEVPTQHATHAVSISAAEHNFREHVAANHLFVGDLTLEGHFVLENAYPSYRAGAAERAAELIQTLKTLGVESFGRQGGFDYQPTARVSTLEAEAAVERGRVRDLLKR